MYNNDKYIIHELVFYNSRESDEKYSRQQSGIIFIDNYGGYYIYSLLKRGTLHKISNQISVSNGTFRLSNTLIDFIKNINFDNIDEEQDCGYIRVLENILINFHKIAEYTHNLINKN